MRLTLRTLLAYLDDVLEPSETREIGQKIRESPAAAAMASRIREAIRRRRLGAPDLEGPGQGLDPNLVAAYLDNALSPEQVVELEQVCLEDDVQLAEAAACHQILTLVMAEGREVPRASLDRYYALGPMPVDQHPPTNGSGRTAADAGVPAIIPAVTRLPESLKQSPWSRVAPIAAVALIVLLAFLLLASDRDLFRGLAQSGPKRTELAQNEPRDDAAASPLPTLPPSPAPATNEATPGGARDTVSAVSTLPDGLDPVPPPDLPETVTPAATTTTVPESKPSLPAAPPPASEPIAPPPEVIRLPIQYVSNEGVLLRFEMGEQHWYVHPRRSEVHAAEIFASPEPFEAVFDFDRGGFKVALLSDSALDILPGIEDARQGIRLNRGRVVLQPGVAGEPERFDFIVQIRQQRYRLRFSGPEAVCGVEVVLREPVGLDRPWDGDGLHAAVFVASGSVEIDPDSDDAHKLEAGQRHVLTSLPWPSATGNGLPQWLDAQRRQGSDTLRRFAARFEKEFDPMLAVDLSIPALTKDPHPKIAELAARCLAVMESYPSLVQALAQTEHEEARAAAIQGLRIWVGQKEGRGPLLKRELDSRYSANEAQDVYRLLWGFTAEDAKDQIASADLVNWLRSNRVEIRELAFQQLVQLTGRKYDYRPLATPSQREPAVQRWIAHLDRNDGALVKAE